MSKTVDTNTVVDVLRDLDDEAPPALEVAERIAEETDTDMAEAQECVYDAVDQGVIERHGDASGDLRLVDDEANTERESVVEPCSTPDEGRVNVSETSKTDPQESSKTQDCSGNEPETSDTETWGEIDFSVTNDRVWAPAQIERDAWMCRKESKLPYAPWVDDDAPVKCIHEDHDEPVLCADCDHQAGYKWGSDGSREYVHTDHETALDWADKVPLLSSDLVYIQREHDPFVFVDGDDVRDPETGAIHPVFEAFLELLGVTYADVSTSGAGVHAVYRGEIPLDGVNSPTFEIDDKPWGSNDDLPAFEVYDGKHVCIATGDHIAGTGTEIVAWDAEAAAAIFRANGFKQRPEPSAERPVDLSDHTPTATSSTGITTEIRDLFHALDRLDAKQVADKTIVQEWTQGERGFLPVWGSPDDGGTANYVDDQIWNDTGHDDGYGGPKVMAAIDAGLVYHAGITPSDVSGKTFFDALDHLRNLGFSIPVFVPEAGTKIGSGGQYDKTPLWALRKAAVALGVCEQDDFVERTGNNGGTYIGFATRNDYNRTLRKLSEREIDTGREQTKRLRSEYYDVELTKFVDEGEGNLYDDAETLLRACLRAKAAGAVEAETTPPILALIPLQRDFLGIDANRDMADGTRERLIKTYHDIEESDLDRFLG